MNRTTATQLAVLPTGPAQKEFKVGMGDLAVMSESGILRTLLGSCIGLVLYDVVHRIGGLAHIVLPASNGDTTAPGKYADTALPALLIAMKQAGAQTNRVTAKLAGGANMFGTKARTIGDQNLDAIEGLLSRNGIHVVGKHCGGRYGRRLGFDVSSGTVMIEWQEGPPVSF